MNWNEVLTLVISATTAAFVAYRELKTVQAAAQSASGGHLKQISETYSTLISDLETHIQELDEKIEALEVKVSVQEQEIKRLKEENEQLRLSGGRRGRRN